MADNISNSTIPTLIVGAGGIGGKIVSEIYQSLDEEQKKIVSAICIDTNQIDLAKLSKKGMKTVTTSSSKTVEEYLDENPEVKVWFPDNPFLARKKMTDGAGQIRACSRLAAEAAIQEGAFMPLDQAIEKARGLTGDPNLPELKVIFICSICGGTGAGLVVQLPYYIRHKLHYNAGLKTVMFRGYFVGPSITEEKNSERQKKANFTNSYAAIKELNAVYELQRDITKAKKLNLPFFDLVNVKKKQGEAIEVPYDFIFMFEKYNADGLSTGGFEKQLHNITETILLQCFSEATADVYGSEDNYIIPRIENNGMDRFGGIAQASAVYPYHGVLNYIVNKWISDAVSKDWCAIDKEYRVNLRIANARTGGRGEEEIGKLGDFYIEKIENDEFDSPFRKYYNETHKIEKSTAESSDVEYVHEVESPISERILTVIDNVSLSLLSDPLFIANKPEVNTQEEIDINYNVISSKLRNIKNGLNALINKYSNLMVSKVFPLEVDEGVRTSANPVSIPDYLIQIHPISARYLLYILKKEIDRRLEDTDSVLNSKTFSHEKRNAVDNTDFYEKTDAKETPTEAMQKIEDRYFSFIAKHTRAYKYIYSELDSASQSEYKTNIAFAQEMAKKKAYAELSARLAVLIDLYEKMFKSIDRIEKNAASEASDFLCLHNANTGTEHYVCASADNKIALYQEVVRSAEINFSYIPEEATWKLGSTIFRKACSVFIDGEDKYDPDDAAKEMEELFREAVIDQLLSIIREKSAHILDMNVIQAMKKQHWLGMKKDDRPENYDEISLSDIDRTFRVIETKAEPYLSYSVTGTPEQRIYWIMNPQCFTKVVYQEYTDEKGNPKIKKKYEFDGVTADEVLKSELIGSTEIYGNDKVNKYTLKCLRAVYCLKASELNLYRRHGRAYDCYAERINNMLGIGKSQSRNLFGEGQIAFVHPHIDKNWHNPTMLPALDPHEEEERQTDILRAFFLGIALRFCRIDVDYSSGSGSVNRWMFFNKRFGGKSSECIYIKEDQPIGTGYQELMEALANNSAMVYEILSYSDTLKEQDILKCDKKNYSDLEQHQILFNLTHTNVGTGDFDTENILMSIFKYYVENGDDFKLKILLTTLSRYFFDYAMDVTGQVKSEANLFYASIVKICIKSFESTYNGLVQKQTGTKGKAFEKLTPEARFARNSKSKFKSFQQAYNSYL